MLLHARHAATMLPATVLPPMIGGAELRVGWLDVGEHGLAAPIAQTELTRGHAKRNKQVMPAQSIRSVAVPASSRSSAATRDGPRTALPPQPEKAHFGTRKKRPLAS